MKKVLSALLFVAVLVACRKDNTAGNESDQPPKKPVSFSIANFISKEENLPNGRVNADTSLAGISDVYYFSYTSSGTQVNYIHKDSTDPGFGSFTDSLAPGTYTIVIMASQKPLITYVAAPGINSHYIGPQMINQHRLDSYGDVFYKKITFTVPLGQGAAPVNVALDRIVGKLQVNILDALPTTHQYGDIQIETFFSPAFFYIGDGSVQLTDSFYQFYLTRLNQFLFENFMLGSTHQFEIAINYKNKNTGASMTKVISNVTVSPNKKTIIQGYLYGAPANGGASDYQIKVNQAWSTDSTVINFN